MLAAAVAVFALYLVFVRKENKPTPEVSLAPQPEPETQKASFLTYFNTSYTVLVFLAPFFAFAFSFLATSPSFQLYLSNSFGLSIKEIQYTVRAKDFFAMVTGWLAGFVSMSDVKVAVGGYGFHAVGLTFLSSFYLFSSDQSLAVISFGLFIMGLGASFSQVALLPELLRAPTVGQKVAFDDSLNDRATALYLLGAFIGITVSVPINQSLSHAYGFRIAATIFSVAALTFTIVYKLIAVEAKPEPKVDDAEKQETLVQESINADF